MPVHHGARRPCHGLSDWKTSPPSPSAQERGNNPPLAPMSCPPPADQGSEENTVTPNASTPSQRTVGMPQDAAGERASTLPPSAPLKPSGRDGENFRVPASGDLRKSAVALFTFLRELVSLRTTVVRNVSSYDRVMWMNDVPTDEESGCVEFRPNNDDEDDWWLQVKKPSFSEPPPLPEPLAARVDPEQLRDSSLEAPGFKESRRKTDVGGGIESPEYAAIKTEFQ